MLKWGSGLRTE